MESFDAHKWFKKQYLEEAKIDEAMMSREEAFEALRDVLKRGNVDDSYAMKMRMALDSLQADEIRVMMDREKANKSVTFSDVREDDLDEIKYPQTDYTRYQLVPRMEMAVEANGKEQTYKEFISSLNDLLTVWYMEGFEKDDVLAFMKVIIPSGPKDLPRILSKKIELKVS